MALKIFTAHMNYGGPHAHDTTVKTKKSFLMPAWDIVLGHKNGTVSDAEYVEVYLKILLASLQSRKSEWLAMLKQNEIVLTCFCTRGKFCHRCIAALFLEKFGARYMGELNTNTGALIHKDRYLTFIAPEVIQMVQDFVIPNTMEEAKSDFSQLVVDPLTISGQQSAVCRQCRENRKALAWTQRGTVQFGMVPRPEQKVEENPDSLLPNWKEDLGSKNFACCSHDVVEGKVEYHCPLFKDLVFGYKIGLTSRGTNLDPCKNCIEHVDGGGSCFGDRCPDGTFPVKEGCGVSRG
jgi:hypothetical protein